MRERERKKNKKIEEEKENEKKEKAYLSPVIRSSACIPLDCKAVVS